MTRLRLLCSRVGCYGCVDGLSVSVLDMRSGAMCVTVLISCGRSSVVVVRGECLDSSLRSSVLRF